MLSLKRFLILLSALLILGCNSSDNDDFVITPDGVPTIALVQLTPTAPTIGTGTTQQLVTTVVFTNGISQDQTAQATYVSSDPTVASVSATGLVTGLSGGQAIITSTVNGASGRTMVTVSGSELTSLSVTPAAATIAAGTSQQFRATGTFADGRTQDLTSSVTWASSNNAIATVDSLGRATGLAPGGPVTITATFGSQQASGNLTVTDAQLTSIAVTSPAGAGSAIALGTTAQLTATGTFSDGSSQALTDAVFESSNPAVATVSGTGLVTSVAPGITTVTVTRGGVTQTFDVTVTAATVQSIALQPAPPYTLGVGQSTQLRAIATLSDLTTQDVTSQSTFLSNDPAVASVGNTASDKGLLIANRVGATTVAVTGPDGVGTTATVTVTVPVVTAATAYAVQDGSTLISFQTTAPGAITSTAPITGLAAGDSIVGIDFRPQNGYLYGLGFNSATGDLTLYNIALGTLAGLPSRHATAIGAPIAQSFAAGTSFGFDFNPTVDRIRVVSSTGVNLRLNPNNGSQVDGDAVTPGVQPDAALNGAADSADGSAYTNNELNADVTTLFALDSDTNSLYIQNPANAGTLTGGNPVTLAGATLDFGSLNGFDILPGINTTTNGSAPATGSALAALAVGQVTGLYSIDLNTGTALELGSIPMAGALTGFAVQDNLPGVPVIALLFPEELISRFNSLNIGVEVFAPPITGLTVGETLVALDFRPATGQLYSLGIDTTTDTGTVYRLDPQTGAATAIGAASSVVFRDAGGNLIQFPDPTVGGYGFDFNPAVDRIRVTTNTGLNFRLNPNTGAPIDGNFGGAVVANVNPDGNINGAASGASGAAYTNSFGQPLPPDPATPPTGTTTLYTIDEITDSLYIQNPPNAGTEQGGVPLTLNGAVLDFNQVNGFDIPSTVIATANNGPAATNSMALAILNVVGNPGIYSINLSTGATTVLFSAGQDISGLAIGN